MGIWQGYLDLVSEVSRAKKGLPSLAQRKEHFDKLIGTPITREESFISQDPYESGEYDVNAPFRQRGQEAPGYIDQVQNMLSGQPAIPMDRAVRAPEYFGDTGGGQMDTTQQASGWLGSNQTNLDRLQFQAGLLDSGYNQSEVGSLMGQINPAAEEKQTTLARNLKSAGVDTSTPEGQAVMLDIMRKPLVQMGGAVKDIKWLTPEQKKEQGMRPDQPAYINKSGEVKTLPKTGFTADQYKAAGYMGRMESANKIITDLENTPGFESGTILMNIEKYTDNELAKFFANNMMNANEQKYIQAMMDWGTAVLRDESGAVLGRDEVKDELSKHFPVPGDQPSTKKQKAASRRQLESGIRNRGGEAYKKMVADQKKQQDKEDMRELEELRKEQGAL